jgi:hypothetical protein
MMMLAHTIPSSPPSLPVGNRLDWRALAACAGRDGRLWFSSPTVDPVAAGVARRICASCPVQTSCAAEAQHLHEEGPLYGTWAGRWFG